MVDTPETQPSPADAPPATPPGGGTSGRLVVPLLVALMVAVVAGLGALAHYNLTRHVRRHDPAEWSGERLYAEYCARCHMPGGQGSPGGFYPSLVARPYAFEEFHEKVAAGSDTMPAFEETLDEEDYRKILDYLAEQRGAD